MLGLVIFFIWRDLGFRVGLWFYFVCYFGESLVFPVTDSQAMNFLGEPSLTFWLQINPRFLAQASSFTSEHAVIILICYLVALILQN